MRVTKSSSGQSRKPLKIGLRGICHFFLGIATIWCACRSPSIGSQPQDAPTFRVIADEEVYRFVPADNGAGPLWCRGSTCLVRWQDRVFASGLETLADAKPLNNCRWLLFERTKDSWTLVADGKQDRTREPCPLVVFQRGQLWLSDNPTLVQDPNAYAGPARPTLYLWDLSGSMPNPTAVIPEWKGSPRFTEHSYRSFAADGKHSELILFQNVDYTHAEWAFRDSQGQWTAGRLVWPFGADYEKPQPIRVCYPCVALRDRRVYFFGVSDIVEPNPVWREFKRKLTGRDWDYDFRRLFFTSCDDITKGEFTPWQEISSREKTCGWITPLDLWVSDEHDVYLLWHERAIDERLRPQFFPEEKQAYELNYAIWRKGQLVLRRPLIRWQEGDTGPVPEFARFHVLPDGRLLVFCSMTARGQAFNKVFAIGADGSPGPFVDVPLREPMRSFFTATPRAGCEKSTSLDLLGVGRSPTTIRYACLEFDR